jgi:hypothetical protein
MDVSLVETRMDGGRLDPGRQRLTPERMEEGAVGRPDLVADAGEGNGEADQAGGGATASLFAMDA